MRAAVLGKGVEQPVRVGLLVDVLLSVLILATLSRLWLAMRPNRQNGDRHVAAWRRAFGLAVVALPILWIAAYPWSLRVMTRRDLNWEQSVALSPLAVVFVASLAAVASVRMMARLWQGRAYKTAVSGIFSRQG